MPQLNPDQLKKRGAILEDMLAIFKKQHPWIITREELVAEFTEFMESKPERIRIINALAATA
jgi:hypothetical protein